MAQAYTPLQLDAFKEVGNIGSGNAATSLSVLLNRPVDLKISEVEILTLEDADTKLGLAEDKITSVLHPLSGDLMGLFWFAIKQQDEQALCFYAATENNDVDTTGLVKEVSNILGGTYLTSLGQMLGTNTLLEPPQQTALKFFLEAEENKPYLISLQSVGSILLVRNRLVIENIPLDCYISLLLDQPSLDKVLSKLGV